MRRIAIAVAFLAGCSVARADDHASVAWTSEWSQHFVGKKHSGADGLDVGDANGDGTPDLAIAYEGSGHVSVAFHPGYADATTEWNEVTVDSQPGVEAAKFGDADGDGDLDIASFSSGEGVKIGLYLSANCCTTWTRVQLGLGSNRWLTGGFADIDSDGDQDIMAGAETRDLCWYENPGATNITDESAWTEHCVSQAKWCKTVFAENVDGDGDMDMVASNKNANPDGRNMGVWWFENNQTDDWVEHEVLAPGGRKAKGMDHADYNGDGLIDYVVPFTDPQEIVYLRRNGSSAWTPTYIPSPAQMTGGWKHAIFADLTGDGQPEVAASGSNNQHMLYAIAPANSRKVGPWHYVGVSGPFGSKIDNPVSADMDDDGDNDLVLNEEVSDKGTWWFENPL